MEKYYRKELRLEGYDYSQKGYYFITVCVQDRLALFGEIEEGKMIANEAGAMINEAWLEIPKRFTSFVLHTFVVMPNHFHAIVEIEGFGSRTLGECIGAFKSITTTRYIQGVRGSQWRSFEKRLWQRNYYEHIIRDQTSYEKFSEYNHNNPLQWTLDRFYNDEPNQQFGNTVIYTKCDK